MNKKIVEIKPTLLNSVLNSLLAWIMRTHTLVYTYVMSGMVQLV